jgi:hypothetical protein
LHQAGRKIIETLMPAADDTGSEDTIFEDEAITLPMQTTSALQ